jgi:L-alanine-DL-glutamate epimerase-like enolase superfamily enzyme
VHGLIDEDLRIEGLTARPLSVPLIEPFVIATGRVDATRAVEIEVRVGRGDVRAIGLGEAACLPPVTHEDQPDILASMREIASRLPSSARLDESFHALCAGLGPVARAGLDTALADAISTLVGLPLRTWLGGPSGPASLETDVTVAIATPTKMADLARAWVKRGFRALKVKVGKDPDSDARALEAIGRAAPAAELRVDANAGYSARQAIELARHCEHLGLRVTCWEQPCAAVDLDGLAEVAAAGGPPGGAAP